MSTDVLVIGAGPFGLSVAAALGNRGVDHLVVGEPMGFWREQMPDGMLLRSGPDWHLDPLGRDTMERFLAERGSLPGDVLPLTRALYLDYVAWFQERRGIAPLPVHVERLDRDEDGRFTATLDFGREIRARRVVLALGMGAFAHVPAEVRDLVPAGRGVHTADFVEFGALAGKRCLIVGGRQSAFEWAALIREAGASAVHVTHRHPSPAFAESDWAWVSPLVQGMVTNPGWFRTLPPDEQQEIGLHLWSEGRLKVEPWLEHRVLREGITLWPETRVADCVELPSGELAVTLEPGERIVVDQVVFATGYKVEIGRISLLARGNLLPQLATRNGFPVLDEQFQTSIPGLYITSMPAAQDFGAFFGFTVAAPVSAAILGAALA